MGHLIILAAAAAVAPAPPPIALPAGSGLVTAIENCHKIGDDAARLACYDRSVSALSAANARGDVTVVDRGQMRQVRRSLFGFSLPRLPFFSNSKDRDVQEEPKELVSTLSTFRDIGNGFYRFTLKDPESTWESTEAGTIYQARPGDSVTLHRGALGSYFVQIGQENWIRAHRIH
ncbi:MAG: hypothetical protein ACJ8FT_10440 [Sphingomonas sp.]